MMNFLDWLGGPDGNAQDRLETQFGFPAADTRRAAEALGPAYLIGLQRLAGDVDGWASLIRAVTPGTGASGTSVPSLTSFFGTDALKQAVAAEAARHSGLPRDMLAAMMPTLAAMTVEAVMRMATPGAQRALAPDILGAGTAEMLRRSANAVEAFSRPPTGSVPFAAVPTFFDVFQMPWMKSAGAGLGAAAPRSAPPAPAPADSAADPFRPAAAFLAAFTKGLASEKPALPAPVQPKAESANPFLLFASAGQDAQADYARRMSALFSSHGMQDESANARS